MNVEMNRESCTGAAVESALKSTLPADVQPILVVLSSVTIEASGSVGLYGKTGRGFPRKCLCVSDGVRSFGGAEAKAVVNFLLHAGYHGLWIL